MSSLQKKNGMTFNQLVQSICLINEKLSKQAAKAVNASLTIRNWMIGMYVAEFELRGSDRAKYGERLLDALTAKLAKQKVRGCGRRQLYNHAAFYRAYPQILRTLSAQSKKLLLPEGIPAGKVRTVSAQFRTDAETLLTHLSYSHFELLIEIAEPLKRAFYEHQCIRGHWSVRELKRQIVTLYFERSGLSRNKKKLRAMISRTAEVDKPEFAVRDPYVFEFLGLKSKEVMSESHLEGALLDRLQDFLLEMGHGFCFEARQRRIVIGGQYCFVDLVFYHRVLKCHVLIELKADEFKHEHIGQLNTYVTWYRKHAMTAGDNPPVGILLCTQKNHAMVEFALAGMDNKLFVKKYQLELPRKEAIRQFLESQIEQ